MQGSVSQISGSTPLGGGLQENLSGMIGVMSSAGALPVWTSDFTGYIPPVTTGIPSYRITIQVTSGP